MLQDLRGTYIRREEPRFLASWTSILNVGAVSLACAAVFLVMVWASLKYGEVPASDPTTFFPYITQVAE
jgi:hypothetical protein